MAKLDRIIILVDMDCFYCQVEEKLDSSLEGKPIAVVQYNAWRGGGIIAVNYLAREKGVTRYMRGAEAKEKCPDIILARVPELRGKADLTKYRDAGKRVADVLQKYTPLLERASVDEAYLDITDAVNKWIEDNNDFDISIENLQNTYAVGYDIKDFLYNIKQNREYCETNYKLAVGGLIAEEIRADVLKQTGYKCSAGIAHNKILAKLVCGLHKPNKQTLLPQESIPIVYKDLPIKKIKSLGGKFGNALSEKLKITHMGELIQFSEKDLLKKFDEKTAKWLYNIARGIDLEPVTTRLVSKSIGCCKNFPGKTALRTPESVEHWLNEFAAEIFERIEKDLKENNRKAKQIVVNFAQEINGKEISSSKSLPLNSYDQFKIAQTCLEAIRKLCLKPDGTYNIKFLGISVGNFEDNKKTIDIASYFKNIQDNRKIPILKRKLEDTSFAAPVLKENSTLISVPALLNQCKMPITYDESNVLKEESSNDEGSYDDENSSIYSAATEELNEDQKGLIYYEDIYPESVASQPIFRDKSRGSTNVIYLGNNINKDTNSDNPSANKDNIEIPSSSSFFTKYFENCNFSDDSNISPVKRNFDTSKILEENSVDSPVENIDYNEISPTQNIENNNQIDSIQQKQYDEIDTETDLDYDHNVECPECNKKILQSQLVSHMDYHFALKIVREESHLYKSTPTPKILKTENPVRQNLKKKVIETEPILTFFKKGELNVENSEVCSECNKRIKLEDIDNHFDYHAAKRLHLEINSHGSSGTSKTDYKSPNKNQIKKSKGIIKRKKPNSNVKDISTFFKSA